MSDFFKGDEAIIGDEARVQRGEHAGRAGTVAERDGKRVRIAPWPGASWTTFWIDVNDICVVR